MTKELDSFAAHMRSARKLKGMSQEDLAAAAGVSAETISNLERAKFSPTFDVLSAVIRELGIDPLDVFNSRKAPRRVSLRRMDQEATLQRAIESLDDRSVQLLLDMAAAIQKFAGKR